MQIFLVLGIALFLTIFGSNQWTRYSKASGSETIQISSSNYAGNLYMYNDYSLQYLYKNYVNIVNAPLNTFININGDKKNYIVYNKKNNFDVTVLNSFYNNYVDFKTYNNYKSTYFLYKASESDSSVPQVYLLTTFDNTDDFKVRNMFGAYNNLLAQKDNPGDSVYWTNSVFGVYNGSSDNPVILSTLPKGAPEIVLPLLRNSIFPTLTNQGFNMQKYFMIIPIYMNN